MAFISNGTTILDAGAFSVGLGNLEFISEATASSSSSIEFTSGIDSTYDIYQFEFINIHPATRSADLEFNLSTDSGSNYNVTKTTTFFRAFNYENVASANLGYQTGRDLAQSTAYQKLLIEISNENDANGNGTLTIFNPASTVFVKHFIGTTNIQNYNGVADSFTSNNFVAGYGNTTSAVNAVSFKFSSGNIDAGTIKMYGIKGS